MTVDPGVVGWRTARLITDNTAWEGWDAVTGYGSLFLYGFLTQQLVKVLLA